VAAGQKARVANQGRSSFRGPRAVPAGWSRSAPGLSHGPRTPWPRTLATSFSQVTHRRRFFSGFFRRPSGGLLRRQHAVQLDAKLLGRPTRPGGRRSRPPGGRCSSAARRSQGGPQGSPPSEGRGGSRTSRTAPNRGRVVSRRRAAAGPSARTCGAPRASSGGRRPPRAGRPGPRRRTRSYVFEGRKIA
jgi:hypothetical protein